MKSLLGSLVACLVLSSPGLRGADDARTDTPPWRVLPLITNGAIDKAWEQIGWGGFAVDKGVLQTECDERGMGLLLYREERFGNCQIRVVFKPSHAKANSGVFVRIDDGVLQTIGAKTFPVQRNKDGKFSKPMLQKIREASENQHGPWYAVHHGYEVQICDDADPFHRTGAIYSLSKAEGLPAAAADGWRTMVITLKGDIVSVDVDGKRVTEFEPAGKDVPSERKWPEPLREPRRPAKGYLGLQNHDPGDLVYFKEISVRPLEGAR